MLAPGEPKFRRRKADRPAEILGAAMAVFAEKGFAAARLDEIASRAGVSKGALYLYFETKEELFRAVVEQAIAPNIQAIRAMIAAHPGPFPDLLRLFAGRVDDTRFEAEHSTVPLDGGCHIRDGVHRIRSPPFHGVFLAGLTVMVSGRPP